MEARAAEVKRWESVHSAYRHHLERVLLLLHPWCLGDTRRQTSAEAERQVHAELRAIEVLVETHGLPAKTKAVAKVRKQLVGVCALVDFWWQGVWQDLQPIALTPMWQRWVEELLLPLM